MPRIEIAPVASIAFNSDVALTAVRCDEHNRGVGLAGGGSTSGSAVSSGGDDLSAILRGLRLNCICRSNKIWIFSSTGSPTEVTIVSGKNAWVQGKCDSPLSKRAGVATAISTGICSSWVDDSSGADECQTSRLR